MALRIFYLILLYCDDGVIKKTKGTMVLSKVQTSTQEMPFDLRNLW